MSARCCSAWGFSRRQHGLARRAKASSRPSPQPSPPRERGSRISISRHRGQRLAWISPRRAPVDPPPPRAAPAAGLRSRAQPAGPQLERVLVERGAGDVLSMFMSSHSHPIDPSEAEVSSCCAWPRSRCGSSSERRCSSRCRRCLHHARVQHRGRRHQAERRHPAAELVIFGSGSPPDLYRSRSGGRSILTSTHRRSQVGRRPRNIASIGGSLVFPSSASGPGPVPVRPGGRGRRREPGADSIDAGHRCRDDLEACAGGRGRARSSASC